MKKITVLLLTVLSLTVSLIALSSCNSPATAIPPSDGDNSSTPTQPDDDKGEIVIPDYKDYDRNAVDYTKIEYKRPDVDKVVAEFKSVAELIATDAKSEEKLQRISELEQLYYTVTTATSIANVRFQKDPFDSYWTGEYTYLATSYPSFCGAVEELYLAAAASDDIESLEDGYFGKGCLKEYYSTNEVYTDELIKLLAKEAELEISYKTLTPSSVTILYKGITDTAQKIIEYYDGGPDIPKIIEIYNIERGKRALSIYVDLLMTRKLIAMNFNRENYLDVYFDSDEHGYSNQSIDLFLTSIENSVIPIYSSLNVSVFSDYFRTAEPDKLNKAQLMNTLFEVYKDSNSDLAEIYSYMLQYGLYDIEAPNRKNPEGLSFTEYLDIYDSPLLYITANGNITDYNSLSYEFGNFVDAFVNRGLQTPTEFPKVSSRALALLTMNELNERLDSDDYKFVLYDLMRDTLTELIANCFYARLEREAYALGYYEISEIKLIEIADRLAQRFGLNINSEVIFRPEHFVEPLAAESCCIADILSLEIFFEYRDTDNAMEVYKTLVSRESDSIPLGDCIDELDIIDPFSEDAVKKSADNIYYLIVGAHYYKEFIGNGTS